MGTTTKPVVDAVAEQQLFWTMVPKECGGLEAPIGDALGVFEELAYADGSTGWSIMANATSSAFAALYCGDDAVSEMFPPGDPGIHAGMFGPVGTACAIDGGYVFSGNYSFGSGTADATWIGAGATEEKDGEPVVTAAGLPSLFVGFFPSDAVEPRGNWDVMGLADRELRLRRRRTSRSTPASRSDCSKRYATRGGAMYRIGLFGLVASGHAGFAMGVGREHLPKCSLSRTASSAWAASKLSARNSCSNMTSRCTTPRCAPPARTSTTRSARPKRRCSPVTSTRSCSSTVAAGDDLRDPVPPRPRALRTRGRARCVAEPEHPAALLP